MKAEFEIVASTTLRDGTKQLRLQPVGEPSFRILEVQEPEEEGTLGTIVIEIDESERYVPKPGDTVLLKTSRPRA